MTRFWVSLFWVSALAAAPADYILTARYVVTMDARDRIVENGAVAIRGSDILAVDTQAVIARRFQAGRRLDFPEGVLMPGLINAHQHAPMVLFRGLADDRRLQDWLEHYIFPAEARNVNADFVRWGTLLACAEMLASGTTTYADMYYFEEVIADATKQCGMRGVLGQTVIGFPSPDAKTPADALKRAEAFLRQYSKDPLIVPAVAPHAIYTTPDDVLRASRLLANRYSAPLLIHLSETRREQEEAVQKRGLTPTGLLEKLGILNGRTLAAHGVWVTDEDLRILRSHGTGAAHCPSSNMMLASGAAPVGKYLSAGIALGLGTDGFAGTNNDASMFEEMDLAAKLQKVTRGDPQALTARQALAMATRLGARALGLQDLIGSLEPGKRADLIAVDLSATHMQPLYGIESQLVYAAKAADVRTVLVNGRVVVQDRRMQTMDLPQVLTKARAFRDTISRSLVR